MQAVQENTQLKAAAGNAATDILQLRDQLTAQQAQLTTLVCLARSSCTHYRCQRVQ